MQDRDVEAAIAAFAGGGVIGITDSGTGGTRRCFAVAWNGERDPLPITRSFCRTGTARLVSEAGSHVAAPGSSWAGAVRSISGGGVLTTPGCDEAAVDIARLSGLPAPVVVCDAPGTGEAPVGPDGPVPEVAIDALAAYRWRTEVLVERVAAADLPTEAGGFTAVGYRAIPGRTEHIALVLGEVNGRSGVLARVHSACLTGDVFSSLRCDCGEQLKISMEMIADEGSGIVVYNPSHEGRGTGLLDKLAAYRLQDQGFDTVDANLQIGHAPDTRHYGVDAQILLDLGVESVRLLTNNPDKVDQLSRFGVRIVERLPIWTRRTPHNAFYLDTKIRRLGHLGVPS